jgi:hypothetical protein
MPHFHTSSQQNRWARIAELEVLGRVMTTSQQNKIRLSQERNQRLEEMADRILNTYVVKVSKQSFVVDKSPVPDANVFLPKRKKTDKLALIANQVLLDIQNQK